MVELASRPGACVAQIARAGCDVGRGGKTLRAVPAVRAAGMADR